MFKTRIQMVQIGVRDETKLIGGFGHCGRELCCCSYMKDFKPVSIDMAKEQELSLNPVKISGVCGRLMCCLAYENEFYKEMKRNYPRRGAKVTVKNKPGVVKEVDILKGRVTVKCEDGEIERVPVGELTIVSKGMLNIRKDKKKEDRKKEDRKKEDKNNGRK